MTPGSAASPSGAGKAAATRQNAAPRQTSPIRLAPRRAIGLRPSTVGLGWSHSEKAPETRVELVVVAGELVTGSDVDQRIALIEDAEIGVRLEAVVHEAPIIAVDDHHARHLEMRVGVAGDEVLH